MDGTPKTSPETDTGLRAGLKVAYLANQYPKVSHTFIRREILALEAMGVTVRRLALRGWDAEVVDAEDKAEKTRTRYLLDRGLLPLLGAALRCAWRRPKPFFGALRLALSMSRKSVRPLPYHLIYLAHAARIREWLEEDPVDHLHAHFGTNPAEVALLVKALGGPRYSFTVHGADEFDNAGLLALDRKAAGSKFIAAISWFTRSQMLRSIAPEDWDKVKIIHCGLAAGSFADSFTPFPETPTFLCIGRLSGEKGHLILLEAFAKLARSHPQAQLVLAGDGDLRPTIEKRIADLGLGDRVRITGWIDAQQVRDEILGATVLVQPSFMEGLPVVIMEAMAQHRPVISTYIAGIPELVRHGETGWLVPAGNIDDLAAQMENCLDAPAETLQQMGQTARIRVHEQHNIETEARKLAELFSAPAS